MSRTVSGVALAVAVIGAALVSSRACAADRDAVTCPASLPPAKPGGKRLPFLYLDLNIGSPDGKLGTIEAAPPTYDPSGRHGREVYPMAGEPDLFLRCHYEGGHVTTTSIPAGTKFCEVDYTHIHDYDPVADRIFCR
jgi:hypothetical protein